MLKGLKLLDNKLSRNRSIKIPQIVENIAGAVNTMDDLFATQQAFDMAENKKFKKQEVLEKSEDAELTQVSKIPDNSSELIVISRAKKLGAYVMAVTVKSPAKYRAVFVNRMQNLCLDVVQALLQANFIRQDEAENKKLREKFQTDAIIKLKMLAYISMIAENAGCILTRQYKQISLQIGDVVNLTAAWKKSDDEKWRIRH